MPRVVRLKPKIESSKTRKQEAAGTSEARRAGLEQPEMAR